MKELSIEEKAKRYDKAIKVAENIHKFSSDPAEIKRMEEIFPEFKESEDERIRKEIIKYFKKYQALSLGDYNVQDILAWLEKQGKQKSTDDYNLTDIENSILNFAMQFHDNRMKPEAEWEDELKMLRDNIKIDPWSEEDEVKINRIVACLENLNVADNDILLKDVDWLKSLRPQNTWKPSEEQIKVCKEVYADILSAKGFDLGTVNGELNRLEEELKRLKS